MEPPNISSDDLIDVMEMTSKIESHISNIFQDNDKNLAMSAFMSATSNSMIAQCKTLDEVVFYRNLFVIILDSSVRSIQIKGKD